MIYQKWWFFHVFPIATSVWNYQKDLEGTTCPWGYHRTHWVRSPFHPYSHLFQPHLSHALLLEGVNQRFQQLLFMRLTQRIIKCLVVILEGSIFIVGRCPKMVVPQIIQNFRYWNPWFGIPPFKKQSPYVVSWVLNQIISGWMMSPTSGRFSTSSRIFKPKEQRTCCVCVSENEAYHGISPSNPKWSFKGRTGLLEIGVPYSCGKRDPRRVQHWKFGSKILV